MEDWITAPQAQTLLRVRTNRNEIVIRDEDRVPTGVTSYSLFNVRARNGPFQGVRRNRVVNAGAHQITAKIFFTKCWLFTKRYFIIDQQIARHFVHYSECLYQLLPYYAVKIINALLTSRI